MIAKSVCQAGVGEGMPPAHSFFGVPAPRPCQLASCLAGSPGVELVVDGAGAEEADKVGGEDDEQHTILKAGATASADSGIGAGTNINAGVPVFASRFLPADGSSRRRRREGEEEAAQGGQHAAFFPRPAGQTIKESSDA